MPEGLPRAKMPSARRRKGDTVVVPGDYQHRALTEGPIVQRFWHHAKQQSVGRFLPPAEGAVVVDVGCGSGVLSAYLGEFGASVLGIDGNPEAVAFANRTYATTTVRFREGLVDEAFGEEESVDEIYCMEVIEHIYLGQARAMLRSFHRLLKPGGKVFISTPNYRSLWPAIEWVMDRLKIAPRMRGQQHVEFYHARKLRRLCGDSGFTIERQWSCLLFAPWVAPLSWRLAKRLLSLESSLPIPVGAMLMCILVKPGHSVDGG